MQSHQYMSIINLWRSFLFVVVIYSMMIKSLRLSVVCLQHKSLRKASPLANQLNTLFSSKRENDWVPYKPPTDVLKPTIKIRKIQDEISSERDEKRDSNWRKLPTDNRRRNEETKKDFKKSMSSDFKRFDKEKSSFSLSRRNSKPWEVKEKTEPVYGNYDGDHLYGINPVRLALKANRRKMKELILQDDFQTGEKEDKVNEIRSLAEQRGVKIRYFPKHDLNMIAENRPHQGVILRATALDFEKALPLPQSETYKVVLALDEVWDPQNLGALLRSGYFLGCEMIVVCGKNSAPLSPAVSKASAGAMELVPVFSTDNMMKWLDKSKENGWQVIGTDVGSDAVPFRSIPLSKPTILVLGNEGHGIRTNILRRCDHLALIEKKSVRSNSDIVEVSEDGVDSLNVSVTGGILLHHLTSQSNLKIMVN